MGTNGVFDADAAAAAHVTNTYATDNRPTAETKVAYHGTGINQENAPTNAPSDAPTRPPATCTTATEKCITLAHPLDTMHPTSICLTTLPTIVPVGPSQQVPMVIHGIKPRLL